METPDHKQYINRDINTSLDEELKKLNHIDYNKSCLKRSNITSISKASTNGKTVIKGIHNLNIIDLKKKPHTQTDFGCKPEYTERFTDTINIGGSFGNIYIEN